MFVFPNPKEIEVAGVKLGGSAGKNPPALIGTIFYTGHKIISGLEFERSAAEALLNKHIEAARESGLSSMINVFGTDETSLLRRAEFVLNHTKAPVLIDSQNPAARAGALKTLEEIGATKRIVYNSLNMAISQNEINALKATNVAGAILLAYAPSDNSVEGKIALLEKDCAFGKGLLEIANECGIKNVLIDTAMTPVGMGAGTAVRALAGLKAKFGWPTGCAMHNAVSSWDYIRSKYTKKTVDYASNLLAPALGADFLFYGPIENAPHAFDVARLGFELAIEGLE